MAAGNFNIVIYKLEDNDVIPFIMSICNTYQSLYPRFNFESIYMTNGKLKTGVPHGSIQDTYDLA